MMRHKDSEHITVICHVDDIGFTLDFARKRKKRDLFRAYVLRWNVSEIGEYIFTPLSAIFSVVRSTEPYLKMLNDGTLLLTSIVLGIKGIKQWLGGWELVKCVCVSNPCQLRDGFSMGNTIKLA